MEKLLQERAIALLRQSVGNPQANFRSGQLEAIDHLLERRGPLLVVQRTGWGKSNVYFIAAKLLRELNAGPTLIISPLLALMRNQIAAAERAGIRAVRVTSEERTAKTGRAFAMSCLPTVWTFCLSHRSDWATRSLCRRCCNPSPRT